MVLFAQQGELGPLLEKFTTEEEEQMKRMLQRMDILAKVISHTVDGNAKTDQCKGSSTYASSSSRWHVTDLYRFCFESVRIERALLWSCST